MAQLPREHRRNKAIGGGFVPVDLQSLLQMLFDDPPFNDWQASARHTLSVCRPPGAVRRNG
jgi:hypothetical protein